MDKNQFTLFNFTRAFWQNMMRMFFMSRTVHKAGKVVSFAQTRIFSVI